MNKRVVYMYICLWSVVCVRPRHKTRLKQHKLLRVLNQHTCMKLKVVQLVIVFFLLDERPWVEKERNENIRKIKYLRSGSSYKVTFAGLFPLCCLRRNDRLSIDF